MGDTDNRVDRNWHALIDIGPRFEGTPGAGAAAKLIAAAIDSLGLSPAVETFEFPGWSPGDGSRVVLLGPETRTIPSYPMLWSAGTKGPVKGRLRAVGFQTVWGGLYSWRKFAVVCGDDVVAYISGRPDGLAIPQPMAPGLDSLVPHVAVGHLDLAQLDSLLDGDVTVEVEVQVDARMLGPLTGQNVRCRVGDGLPRVVAYAHYDTMWSTAGAYDNASGVAAVLEMAARCREPAGPPTVEFILFGGEEWHLAGSRSYVASHLPELREVDAALCFDGIGRGDECEVWCGPESFESALLAAIRRFQSRTPDRKVRFVSKCPPPPGSDHASFYDAGINAAEITFNDLELLHRPEDVPNESSRRNIDYMIDLGVFLINEFRGART